MILKMYSRLKILHKFLLSYFVLIVIPLIILSSLTYNRVSKILENYITFSTKQAFEQTRSFLSYKFFRISDISSIISNDSNLSTMLSNDPNHYEISDQMRDMTDIRKFLTSFQNNEDISSVRLYLNNGFIYSNDSVNIFALNQAKASKWYTIFKDSYKKNLWCPTSYLEDKFSTNAKSLSIVSAIKNPNDFQQDIGLVRVDFNSSIVEDILKKTNTVAGSFTYLQNSNGVIVTSSDSTLVNDYKINIKDTISLSSTSNNFKTLYVNDNKCLVTSYLIANTDWYMTTIIPYKSILSKITSIRNDMILLMSVIATIAFSLAFYFSNSLSRRIAKIIKAMRQVHEGNLDTFIENSSMDEIGELIENYNFMITKMAILIEEQYKSGKNIKNAELMALQSQINPHFLYNTLDMINWMSYKNMNKEISSAVKNLANFYKLSLNKGKSIVPIKDELTHISFYVQIQNMRYSDRINLIIDVEPSISEYHIPKITLQPIIENAIVHGILGRENAAGTITISSKLDNDDVILYIKDDGVGIPPERLATILSSDEVTTKGNGYGLKNIDERLKLSYGEKYGLSFRSEYNIGSTVEIKIPAK